MRYRYFCVGTPLLVCCIRITSMNKLEKNIVRFEKKEHLLVPMLGFCAVLASLVAFLYCVISDHYRHSVPVCFRVGLCMWQRFTWYDVRVIGHYLGVLVSFFSIALAVPLVVAVVCQEWEPASRYLLGVGVALILGSALRFMRIQPGRLTHQQALTVTGLSWIMLAFVAAVPLALSGHYGSYLDALFEATSGLTTTGASLVIDLEHLSYADDVALYHAFDWWLRPYCYCAVLGYFW